MQSKAEDLKIEDIFIYNSLGTKKVNLTKSKILIKENEFDDFPEKLFVSCNGNFFLCSSDSKCFSSMDKEDVLIWIIKNYPQWLYNNPEWTEDIEEI